MHITLSLPILMLLSLLPLSLCHFPAHCRCVCHITRDALSKARGDCFLPGAGSCKVRLCRNHNFAGFACCMPHGSPIPLQPMASRTPVPKSFSNPPMMTVSASPAPSVSLHDDAHVPAASHSLRPSASYGEGEGIVGLEGVVGASVEASMEASMEAAMEEVVKESMGPFEMTESPVPFTLALIPEAAVRPHVATIRFAADDMAQLYVNGDLISYINDWTAYATVSMQLFAGDVVGIEVVDIGGKWHGVIAAIEFAEVIYVTGRDEWRSIGAVGNVDGDIEWKNREFRGCEWPMAKVKMNDGIWVPGKSIGFPYRTGAKYVWAENGKEGGSIWLRFVIGGEEC